MCMMHLPAMRQEDFQDSPRNLKRKAICPLYLCIHRPCFPDELRTSQKKKKRRLLSMRFVSKTSSKDLGIPTWEYRQNCELFQETIFVQDPIAVQCFETLDVKCVGLNILQKLKDSY